MLLSQITARPERYQFRDNPWSERTVAAIVSEGINLAKFDAIPLIGATDRDGMYCVAGDGHSRLEAIRRLAADGRLPGEWLIAAERGDDHDEYNVPHRFVSDAEAQQLAWTANLSRDDFGACEEARVFQAMLDSGMTLAAVAAAVHRSESYVRNALPLNGLCRDIREAVGKPHDAGGIDKYSAFALAERCQRYGLTAMQQQELWHRVLKQVSLTPKFVRALLDKIGAGLNGSTAGGRDAMLFALPASVEHAVKDFRDRARQLRRAQLGIEYLMVCKDSGVLDEFPDLKTFVERDGVRMLNGIKARTESDASVLGELCTTAAA